MTEKQKLLETLRNFPNARILVVGDVMLDRYWWGDASRLSPEAPVPVVNLRKSSNIPGGAANVAANIAGFGAEVFLVGIIGQDDPAEEFRKALKEFGISADHLIASENRPTTTKTRVVVHHQQIARVDNETSGQVAREDEENLTSKVLSLIPPADLVVLSDYAKGCLTKNLIADVVAEAKKLKKPVLVDPKSRDFTKYDGATMLTPNLAEALAAADSENLDEGVEKIFSAVGIESLLVTLGEQGMKLFRRDEKPAHFASTARQVFDVTGAGDTVIATLAVALAVNAETDAAVQLANTAAGIVVEKLGTSTVSREELEQAFL